MSPIKEQTSFVYKNDPSAGDIPAIVHYKPSFANAPTPRPIAMIIHGGGYTVCGTFIIPKNQIDTLLDMGFVVVTPEFRLCPQVNLVEGPLADVRDCLRWLRTDFPALIKSRTHVAVNSGRVCVMGQSAGGNLALILGAEDHPPNAIFNVYGAVNPGSKFNHTPMAAFQALPDVDESFINKVFEGPVPLTSPPMLKNGRPDTSTPRNAWMIQNLKKGTHIAKLVPDGNYAAVDGAQYVRKGFPPTVVLHGTADKFVPIADSVTVVDNLKSHGVEHEFITVPDADHMFDAAIGTDDPKFQYIQRGLDFLKRHV